MTFSLGRKQPLVSTPCLVLADFLDSDALDDARTKVAALVPDARFTVGSGVAQTRQLRVDLGDRPDDFYAEGAELALEVEALCEHNGGTTSAAESTVRAIARGRVSGGG
jgi:hypothetical protein